MLALEAGGGGGTVPLVAAALGGSLAAPAAGASTVTVAGSVGPLGTSGAGPAPVPSTTSPRAQLDSHTATHKLKIRYMRMGMGRAPASLLRNVRRATTTRLDKARNWIFSRRHERRHPRIGQKPDVAWTIALNQPIWERPSSLIYVPADPPSVRHVATNIVPFDHEAVAACRQVWYEDRLQTSHGPCRDLLVRESGQAAIRTDDPKLVALGSFIVR